MCGCDVCSRLKNPLPVLKHFYTHLCVCCKSCAAKGVPTDTVQGLKDEEVIFHIDRLLTNKPELASSVGSSSEFVTSRYTSYDSYGFCDEHESYNIVTQWNYYCIACDSIQTRVEMSPEYSIDAKETYREFYEWMSNDDDVDSWSFDLRSDEIQDDDNEYNEEDEGMLDKYDDMAFDYCIKQYRC